MNDRINKLYNDYSQRIKEAFPESKIIIISFGSFAYGFDTSDFDVCNIFDYYGKKEKEKIKDVTINFHIDNNLKIDNDVPFENKCIFSFDDIRKVIKNPPFPIISDKYYISPIIKKAEYLSSIEVKDRILLNILTSKMVPINGHLDKIYKFTEEAWETIIRVIFSNIGNKPLDQKMFLNHMYKNPIGNEKGKDYLGYCTNKKHVLDYLIKESSTVFNRLVTSKKMNKLKNNEYNCSDKWLDEMIKCPYNK